MSAPIEREPRFSRSPYADMLTQLRRARRFLPDTHLSSGHEAPGNASNQLEEHAPDAHRRADPQQCSVRGRGASLFPALSTIPIYVGALSFLIHVDLLGRGRRLVYCVIVGPSPATPR